MAVVTILGAGMMGSALCFPLIDRGHQVRLTGTHLDAEIVEALRSRGHHPGLALDLPEAVRCHFVEELPEAMAGAEIVVLGVSSHGVRWAAEKLAPFSEPDRPVLMISKGLEWDGRALRSLPDVFCEVVSQGQPAARVAPVAVTGPCIAGELARRESSCVVFSGRDTAVTETLAAQLRGPYYRVWTSSDVPGHGACAALKNAYAMGIALATGLHEGRGGQAGSIALHNLESAVFAQAAQEMAALVALAGGKPEVVLGPSGVGDLDVTTNGGRTGRFGRLLGLGHSTAEAIAALGDATLECLDVLETLRSALPVLEDRGELAPEDLPLLRHMAEVALDGVPVEIPLDGFFRR